MIIRRWAMALSVATLASMGACSQPAETTTATPPAAAEFPQLFQTPFRAEANVFDGDAGMIRPLVIIRDGAKLRVELASDEGQQVFIINPEAGLTLLIGSLNGRTMAISVPTDMVPDISEGLHTKMTDTAADVARVGPCERAGATGNEWRHTDATSGDVETACVTDDGILLAVVQGGNTVWETTNLVRGPQDDALFQAPEGVQVSEIGAVGEAMLARLRQEVGQ